MTTTANVLIKTVRQSAHELELWLNARPRKRYLKERKGEYWYIVKDEYRYGQQHLRRYVDAWIESGYDLERSGLKKKLERELARQKWRLGQNPGDPVFANDLIDFSDGKIPPDEPPGGWPPLDDKEIAEIEEQGKEEEGRWLAARKFAQFITGPFFDQLYLCVRCDGYVVKRFKHSKKYCSTPCARAASATTAIQETRKREREERLNRVQRTIDELDPKVPLKDWKRVVADKSFPETLTFITRATNKGDLSPPAWIEKG